MQNGEKFNFGKLDDIISKFSDPKFISLNKLQSRLVRNLKNIKLYYKNIIYNDDKNKIDNWIYDNYYIIEREGKLLQKSFNDVYLPASIDFEDPDIYHIFKTALEDSGFNLTTENVISVIDFIEKKRYIKSFEIDFLGLIIKTALIEIIYDKLSETSIENFDIDNIEEIIGKSINNLRIVDSLDIEKIIFSKNRIDKILRKDYNGIYNNMNDISKRLYRYKISKISLEKDIDEVKLAISYINSSTIGGGHVGEYIYKDYDRYIKNNVQSKFYIPLLFFVPMVFAICSALIMGDLLYSFLVYFPFWEILKPVIDYYCMFEVETEYVPRLELGGEIPEEGRTVVVVSVLLNNLSDMIKLEEKLKDIYYKNMQENIHFCILADLKESEFPVMNDDKNLINAMSNLIKSLNYKHGNKFMVMVRKRTFSKTQMSYCGYERKRGAIADLVDFIKGKQPDYELFEGDYQNLCKCNYILALDYDTDVLIDTVESLVSVALHPINKPVINNKSNTVVKGYGIISPRMVIDLKDSLKTPFSKIMGGVGGISSYDVKIADIYQDLYDEGIFCGKGLISIDAFYKVMYGMIPDDRVLSHDIIEGCFLRTKFVGDIELIDGYPNNATSFFKRLHRWIRGDWQNISYLFGRIETKKGCVKNPINGISKFKIFDNLRRSISPVFSLLCFIFSVFSVSFVSKFLFFIGIFSVLFPYLFSLINCIIRGGIFSLSIKYYSRVVPQSLEIISQAFYNFVFLVKYSFNALDAVFRSLYRIIISGKNLLEWTTFDQVDKIKNGFFSTLSYYWRSELIGILFIFSDKMYLRLLGLIFASLIPLVIFSKREYVTLKHNISNDERDELLSLVSMMSNYYNDYCIESENYLPPDNVQETPIFRVAHRTSPTNIGLMMLCLLAQRDFMLIDSKTLFLRLNNTLTTVEKLEKWNGNLYNWYDTKDLRILNPSFVSTVDSGNFVCCMVALKEGLKEYVGEERLLEDLILRIQKLIDETNIGVFYDHSKKALRIGYDSTNNCFSESHYDMLMSEARMTSYFAVAKRQVPKRHWSSLGRTLKKLGAYTGPVSWTGTMFEYFMPELLLQCVEGSLGYEGLRYCLYCQKQRVKKKGIPFGISESGYYAFDNQLNYQYKAYGVQKIALKKDMDKDLVVSPYSSYLVLPYDFSNSLKNLLWLKSCGVFGKYGHYEAVDFTKERVGNQEYCIIKSYMAHHIGMSIIAVSNALLDNVMQRRFLTDNYMKSANELLKEKVSVGAVMFEDFYLKENDKSVPGELSQDLVIKTFSPLNPKVRILSNADVTGVFTDIGVSYIKFQGKDMTIQSTDILRNPVGIIAGVRQEDKVIPFSFAPNYNQEYEYQTIFSDNCVTYMTNSEKFQLGMKCSIHKHLPCQQIQFVVKNNSNQKTYFKFMMYLQPILENYANYNSHLAFSKLFLSIEFDKERKLMIARRKLKNEDKELYVALGFLEDVDFEYETNRENILTRPKGIFSLFDSFETEFKGSSGIPDPCMCVRFKSFVKANAQNEYTAFILSGYSKEQIINDFVKLRGDGKISNTNCSKSLIPINSLEGRISESILPCVLYKCCYNQSIVEAVRKNKLDVTSVWKFGISGDLPIVMLKLDCKSDIETIKNYLNCQNKLRLYGIEFDVAIIYNKDKFDFDAAEFDNYSNFINIKGGIYIIDISAESEEIYNLLVAISCYIGNDILRNDTQSLCSPITINSVNKLDFNVDNDVECYQVNKGVFFKESFCVNQSPQLPWSHVLANPFFGTLVSDKSLGYTFAVNSRENKLTPWINDTMSDNNGELILLRIKDKYYNIIDGSTAIFEPNCVRYLGQIEGIKFNVKVEVPIDLGLKNISINLENTSDNDIDFCVAYYIEPVLGVDRDKSKYINPLVENDILYFNNPFNTAVDCHIGLCCDRPALFLCDRHLFMQGKWEEAAFDNIDCCGACIVFEKLKPGSSCNFSYKLIFSEEKSAIAEIKDMTEFNFHKNENMIKVNTKDKYIDFMFNTWLPHQILSSRIYARTGFFQCGGAFGFRDQLQDVSAYLFLDPEVAKTHIIRSCSSQFPQGDVLHWWHNLPSAKSGTKGVRTRYTDDLLWLAYAVCEYVEKTNDYSILDEEVYYCNGDILEQDEHEKYMHITRSDKKDTVYEHCIKAIERAYKLGDHGLPLIGGGDWNDGYNKVGIIGKGESVWLAQFLSIVLNRFSLILDYKNDKNAAELYRIRACDLLSSVDEHCWDADHYIRAFFDNGEKMGSYDSDECKIDSLSQSFSVISQMPDIKRVRTAMDTAYRKLVDEEYDIIKLFYPPFDSGRQFPGYVKFYPPGIRENGGQYTHGAVWLAMATLMLGENNRGYELIKMLNPAYRYSDKELSDKYKLEPYAISADIYTNSDAYARGGWSLYTGSAGWYYKLLFENFFGIKISDGYLKINPTFPDNYTEAEVCMKYSATTLNIKIRKQGSYKLVDNGKVVKKIELDGMYHDIEVNI